MADGDVVREIVYDFHANVEYALRHERQAAEEPIVCYLSMSLFIILLSFVSLFVFDLVLFLVVQVTLALNFAISN